MWKVEAVEHILSLQYKLVKFSYKQIALCIQSIKHKPIKNYATSSSYARVAWDTYCNQSKTWKRGRPGRMRLTIYTQVSQHSMGHFQTLSLTCLCMHDTVGHLFSSCLYLSTHHIHLCFTLHELCCKYFASVS